MAGKLACMCGPVLSKYLGTEGNRYGKYLKIELPDYTFLLLYHYYTILV